MQGDFGNLTCFTGRLQGKPASDEPKRRTPKHPEGPTTGARSKPDSLCSHPLSDNGDSEATFEQDGDDSQPLPASPDKEEFHPVRQLSQLQLPALPAAAEQSDSAADKTQLAPASQAGEGLKSSVSDESSTAATEPQTPEVQTDVNGDKEAQGEAKQPMAGTTSATGLIAAFRPVEQLPASSAAASTAGSDASDRQAADDLQEIEFRSHLHALLLRAKVLRLEWTAHTPEDAHEEDNAGTSLACKHLPCCYSAICAILCPLFSIPASSCTRLDKSAFKF